MTALDEGSDVGLLVIWLIYDILLHPYPAECNLIACRSAKEKPLLLVIFELA